ncbi:hypothetical protein EBU71_16440 [bacterium]|nr:hypothetical protein [Candidatus Elulimicrobium humile]
MIPTNLYRFSGTTMWSEVWYTVSGVSLCVIGVIIGKKIWKWIHQVPREEQDIQSTVPFMAI